MPITFFDPRQPTGRWTCWRKQAVVEALARGEISTAEILQIHGISPEELSEWQRRNGTGGEAGRKRLRALDLAALADRQKPVDAISLT